MEGRKGDESSSDSDDDVTLVKGFLAAAVGQSDHSEARTSTMLADVQAVKGGGNPSLTASAELKGIVEKITDERIFSESEKDLLINVAAVFNHSNQKDISVSRTSLKALLQKIMLVGNMLVGNMLVGNRIRDHDKINHWLTLNLGENCLGILVKAILKYKVAHTDEDLNGVVLVDGNSALESMLALVKSYIQFMEAFFQEKEAILKIGSDLGEYWYHCINNTKGIYEIGGMTGCLFEVPESDQYMMMLRGGELSCIKTPEKAFLPGCKQMFSRSQYLKFSSNSLIFKRRTPIQCFAAYLAYVSKDQTNNEDFLLFQSMMFYLFLSKVDGKTADNFFMYVIDPECPSDNEQVLFLRNKIQSLSLNTYVAVGEAQKDPAVSGIFFKGVDVVGTTEGKYLKIKSQGVFVKIKGVGNDKKIGDLDVKLSIDSFDNKYKKKYEELLEKLRDDCRSELTIRLKGLEKDGAYRKILSKLFNHLFPGELEKKENKETKDAKESKDAGIDALDETTMISLELNINDITREYCQYNKKLTENSDAVDSWKLLWKVKMWKALHARLVKLILLDSAEASGLKIQPAAKKNKSKKKKKKKKKKRNEKREDKGEISAVVDNFSLNIDGSKIEASQDNSHTSACEFKSFEPEINRNLKDQPKAPIMDVSKTIVDIPFKHNDDQKKLREVRTKLRKAKGDVSSLEELNKEIQQEVSKLIAERKSLQEQLNSKEVSLAEDALQLRGLQDEMANKDIQLECVKKQKDRLKKKVQELESQLLMKDKKLSVQQEQIVSLKSEITTHKAAMQKVVEESKQLNENLTKQSQGLRSKIDSLEKDRDKLKEVCCSVINELADQQTIVRKKHTSDGSEVDSNRDNHIDTLSSQFTAWAECLSHRPLLADSADCQSSISNRFGDYFVHLHYHPYAIQCEDKLISDLAAFLQHAIDIMSKEYTSFSTAEKILTLLASIKLKLNDAISVNLDNAVSEKVSGGPKRLGREKMSI